MNQCPRLLTEHVLLPDKLKCRVFLVRTNLAPPLRTYKHSVQAKEEAAGFLAWVFVTEGMLANKQAEMVFVLKLDEKEASNLDNTDKLVESVPTLPLTLFKALWIGASAKRVVGEGHLHHFGTGSFLRPSITGVAFQTPDNAFLPGNYFVHLRIAPVPNSTFEFSATDCAPDETKFITDSCLEDIMARNVPYLFLLTLFDDEVELAKAAGTTRVVTLLGKHYGFFPYPPWSDRDRASVCPKDMDLTSSILTQAPHVKIAGALVQYCASAGKVTIAIPKHGVKKLATELNQIALDSVVIFDSYYNSSVDGQIVWQPEIASETGVEKMEVLSRPNVKGDVFGGAFAGFVPQQPADETILYEDGFMVMLSDGSWSLLRRCLAQGRNCLIQSDTEKGLNAQVQFLDEEEEQGHCEKEHGGKKEGKAEMMILTPQVELKERVEMDDLASYAKEIIKFLKFYLSQDYVKTQLDGTGDLVLQFEIFSEGRLDLKMGFRPVDPPGLGGEFKSEVQNIVQSVELPKVLEASIQFQVYFPINHT